MAFIKAAFINKNIWACPIKLIFFLITIFKLLFFYIFFAFILWFFDLSLNFCFYYFAYISIFFFSFSNFFQNILLQDILIEFMLIPIHILNRLNLFFDEHNVFSLFFLFKSNYRYSFCSVFNSFFQCLFKLIILGVRCIDWGDIIEVIFQFLYVLNFCVLLSLL